MRILVIEDDAVLIDGLKVGLGLAGFSADTVSTLADAKAAIESDSFDALVLDRMLPTKQGIAIVRDLRKQISGLCIPHYILDLPGGHGKVELGHAALREIEPNRYIILDRHGDERLYQE